MIYLLDTNVCVRYLRGRNGEQIEARLNAANPGDVALCSVVKAELLYGAARSQQPDKIWSHTTPASSAVFRTCRSKTGNSGEGIQRKVLSGRGVSERNDRERPVVAEPPDREVAPRRPSVYSNIADVPS